MKRFGFILCCLLILTGCGETALHHNLQEIEADEILVVLNQNGIEAKKEKEVSGQEISWKVAVKNSQLAQARQILIANNMPRRKELGLSGVYKEKGLIPTPDEQKARFLLALKGEIINSLQTIPGVVSADIVLNIPDENEFSQLETAKKKPTASVVVKTRNEEVVAQTVTEGKVQRFVANSVPNLDPNDVAVIVSRTDAGAPMKGTSYAVGSNVMSERTTSMNVPPSDSVRMVKVGGIMMSPESVGTFRLILAILLILLVGVSGFLIFNIMRLNRLKHRVQRGRAARAGLTGGASGGGFLPEGQSGTDLFDVGANERQRI